MKEARLGMFAQTHPRQLAENAFSDLLQVYTKGLTCFLFLMKGFCLIRSRSPWYEIDAFYKEFSE